MVGGPTTQRSGPERVLERVMEAFHHPIGLWMVCCCLRVLDVEQAAQGGGELSARSDVMTAGTPNLLTHP